MENQSDIQRRLAQARPLIMDGGTGTEMEKRGVPMEERGWSASSTIKEPETLRTIHEEYIRAGAEIIITNTYSSSRHVLEACTLGERFDEINRTAVRVARAARERVAEHPVWVAGSISTATFGEPQPAPEVAAVNFADQAALLAEEGVDLIVLEMMRDITYTEIALTAARQTGLPVWVGYSTTINDAGQVQLAPSTSRPILLAEALQKLAPEATALVSIMHTLTEDIAPSLEVLNANWSGAVGVYAHSGEFIMPNWQFIDMISPEAYATEAEKWVAAGVSMIGGCCGIGPEHIRLLAERLSAPDPQNK